MHIAVSTDLSRGIGKYRVIKTVREQLPQIAVAADLLDSRGPPKAQLAGG
jgi:hypothetical protein